jgi:hypothetical protein
MAKLIIKIDPKTKQVSYDVNGVVGQTCTDLTAMLTAGKEVTEARLKEEYYDGQVQPAWETE